MRKIVLGMVAGLALLAFSTAAHAQYRSPYNGGYYNQPYVQPQYRSMGTRPTTAIRMPIPARLSTTHRPVSAWAFTPGRDMAAASASIPDRPTGEATILHPDTSATDGNNSTATTITTIVAEIHQASGQRKRSLA